MSQNISKNQFRQCDQIAGVYNRFVFVVTFIFFVFLGQMVCFGASASYSRPSEKKIEDVWELIGEGDLAAAGKLLKVLKHEHPDDLLIQVSSAYLSLEEGEYDHAEMEFGKIIRLGEGNEDIAKKPKPIRHAVSLAYRGLGFIFLQKSKIFDAKAFYSKSFYAFLDVPSYIQFAIILRKYDRDFKVSKEIHRQILKDYPKTFANNRIQLAILYLCEGEKEEAEKLVSGLSVEGYYAFDWAAFYSVAGNVGKTIDSLKIYLDQYCSYPKRYHQILYDVKNDVDFENFRKSPQFDKWLEKATTACGSSVTTPV